MLKLSVFIRRCLAFDYARCSQLASGFFGPSKDKDHVLATPQHREFGIPTEECWLKEVGL